MQDQWPIGAIDLFHLHTHDELRAQRLGPNACTVVAELDGRVDIERVQQRLRHAAVAVPELRWRMGRNRRFERVWREGGPGPELCERRFDDDLVGAAMASLNEPIDSGAPWRIHVLHGPERDAVSLTWFHAATDARGASRLLAWLGDENADVPDKRFMTGDRLLDKLDAQQERELTKAYVAHVHELGLQPILSLQRASGRRQPGEQRAVRVRLSVEETKSLYGSVRKRAGPADTSLMLWAAGRLVDSLMKRRGLSPPRQLVPVPVSLDPKKGSTRMFGNHLTMMMLALDRDDLRDEATAVAHLAAQRRDIVRNKYDVGMLAAIRTTRHVPRVVVNYISRHPFGGERSSYVLSNPGEIIMDSLFGLSVRDAFAVPALLPAPGFQVTSDGFAGQLSLMVMFRDGYVSAPEVTSLLPALKRDLLP